MNGRKKAETIAAWQRLLDVSLDVEVTVKEVCDVVGLSYSATAQWLRNNVQERRQVLSQGRSTNLYRREKIQSAVREMQGPGNRVQGPARNTRRSS